jgi:hypothetical protein
VSITPSKIWDKTKARESWGDEICTLQVDLDKARAVMTGDQFAALYKEGLARVEVKIT